ncbi:hypothetical protein IFM89_038362 [Coptis chinensis]|uniref:Protein kinase domain-containing protein n=1 Tax=Coptis chinensis TaxID=261450 RepID=A0A835M309_9MAGN|nr:hypothetical protein IFM89_038362 [Coptis chinensis]
MRVLMLLLLVLFNMVALSYGRDYITYSSALVKSILVLTSARHQLVVSATQEILKLSHSRFSPSESPRPWRTDPISVPLPAPASSPAYQGSAASPRSGLSSRHHHRHWKHRAVSPTPSAISGCEQINCVEPLTSTPIGSPCGCVLPMQVEIHLGVAPYAVFPLVDQLEIEVAAGIYLKQSQVSITGASADSQDQGTIVNVNLVPLGEKFDNTTALLIYERFWGKKVPIDRSLFGDYDVKYVRYQGIGSLLSTGMESSTSVSLVSAMAACILSVKTFSLAELEKATEKFSSKKILGEGGFGCVYHGILDDGTEVAVKLLTREDQNGDREFIAEVEMLSRLHHRNLVKLIGICVEDCRRCLVYEVVHNGSVESHLHGVYSAFHYFTLSSLWYVAPEYAMTGHLLVKSDVYSYGVVLLELLSGRKPVDMSQPQGQENLVTWARPLLTTREGLEQLVDPALCGNFDFDDMARVASIASMCVHPEVTQRPFMGEVVQALKLIYNDMDETCDNCSSQKESPSVHDSDFKGDLGPSDSWWESGGATPRLRYGYASSYITMEYSSGPLEETDNRLLSPTSLVGEHNTFSTKHISRSGPLRTTNKLSFFPRGSGSEPGGLSRRSWNGRFWV